MTHAQEWNKNDAELRIREVFAGAKNGETQKIKDSDGTFELTFVPSSEKPNAGEYLSRGGPNDA